jgi:hypothetical protein
MCANGVHHDDDDEYHGLLKEHQAFVFDELLCNVGGSSDQTTVYLYQPVSYTTQSS